MTHTQDLASIIADVPKAELHLHLEGSISPETVSLLGARRGVTITPEAAAARYAYTDFAGFLEAFKWATGYLKTPEDYALITHRLADELVRQRVIYAEITVSVGVMERYGQNVEANFAAIDDVARRYRENGQLRIAWIFDATRQFGANAAMKVAVHAAKFQKQGVVAFGIGGDELAVPTANFRAAYRLRPQSRACTSPCTPAKSAARNSSARPSTISAPNASATASPSCAIPRSPIASPISASRSKSA